MALSIINHFYLDIQVRYLYSRTIEIDDESHVLCFLVYGNWRSSLVCNESLEQTLLSRDKLPYSSYCAQELRVPCLVIDAIMVFGLHRWESRLKADKALLDAKRQADVKHETDKRNITSLKAGERAQRKAEEKKLHNTTGKNANFAPTNHIQQPDKNTKKKT
jgi:hypothetical protein